jgi:hypothetical protein
MSYILYSVFSVFSPSLLAKEIQKTSLFTFTYTQLANTVFMWKKRCGKKTWKKRRGKKTWKKRRGKKEKWKK